VDEIKNIPNIGQNSQETRNLGIHRPWCEDNIKLDLEEIRYEVVGPEDSVVSAFVSTVTKLVIGLKGGISWPAEQLLYYKFEGRSPS
jgi:NifU-like protein involved in Fe-S cluster formation